jgi:hypothetical protein
VIGCVDGDVFKKIRFRHDCIVNVRCTDNQFSTLYVDVTSERIGGFREDLGECERETVRHCETYRFLNARIQYQMIIHSKWCETDDLRMQMQMQWSWERIREGWLG